MRGGRGRPPATRPTSASRARNTPPPTPPGTPPPAGRDAEDLRVIREDRQKPSSLEAQSHSLRDRDFHPAPQGKGEVDFRVNPGPVRGKVGEPKPSADEREHLLPREQVGPADVEIMAVT